MAKSCDFKTTEDSTKSWFRTNGLIDKSLNILNLREFRKKNVEFSNLAKQKYNTDGKLFLENNTGKIAIPNTPVFRAIDNAKNPIQKLPRVADVRDVSSIDSTARQRLFKGKNTIPTSEALLAIINTNSNPVIKKTAEFLLNNLPSVRDFPITLLPSGAFPLTNERGVNVKAAGVYSGDTQSIEMAEFANFPRGEMDVYVIHEIVHALTYRQARQKGKLSDDLMDLFTYAKSIVKEDHYGLTDFDEFLTEVFSNSAFISTLSKYPPSPKNGQYKNLLEEILAWIRSALKISNSDTLYDEAISLATNIVKENFEYMQKYPNTDPFSYNEFDTQSFWQEFENFNSVYNIEYSQIDNQEGIDYQLPQGREIEEYKSSEKTIRDLAAKMSDRIGIPIEFESGITLNYSGKLKNGVAYINLAYATLDTVPHEILAHPIIRALKMKSEQSIDVYLQEMIDKGIITKEC
jgi:hypothetical protein